MFEDTKEPEDIFEGADQDAAPSQLVRPSLPNQSGQSSPSSPSPVEDVVASGPSKTLIIIAVIAVLGFVVIAVALVYIYLSRQTPAPAANQLQQPVTQLPTTQTADTQALPVVPLTETPAPETQLPVDTDRDGLSDEEEAENRTNPTLVDSDDDDLTDYDEIRVWNTDPLDPDSDNDGYPDGMEVRSGYDPNAVGARLLTLPGAEGTVQPEQEEAQPQDASPVAPTNP